MLLVVRPFLMRFCLWLVVWTSAIPALAAGDSCKAWNTKGFFKRAGVADVSRCLDAGAYVNARTEIVGQIPPHFAARYSTTPAIVTNLIKATESKCSACVRAVARRCGVNRRLGRLNSDE